MKACYILIIIWPIIILLLLLNYIKLLPRMMRCEDNKSQ